MYSLKLLKSDIAYRILNKQKLQWISVNWAHLLHRLRSSLTKSRRTCYYKSSVDEFAPVT